MDNSINGELRDQTVHSLCLEFWKLCKNAARATDQLNEKDGKRLTAKINYSKKQLETLTEKMGLKLVEFDGEEFHPGIPASADNAGDFEDGKPLVVTRTLEPAVVQDMRLLRPGRVVVGPIQKETE